MSKEEVKSVETEVEETNEEQIDFNKFDEGNKPKEEPTPDQKIKELEARAKAAEERAARVKKALDKATSDRASLSRELQEKEQAVEEPLEKLVQYEEKLRAYELNEKKTNLTYSLTETLGINKEASQKIVGAIYNEDTNELSVGDLEMALRDVINSVRNSSYQEGYKTRDTEVASGKPRSLGQTKAQDVFDEKLHLYKQNTRRR